jgi:ABC-type Zn2+ transport system substrate-binding protein/surface adhesin
MTERETTFERCEETTTPSCAHEDHAGGIGLSLCGVVGGPQDHVHIELKTHDLDRHLWIVLSPAQARELAGHINDWAAKADAARVLQ